jgi:hypothetical protein
MGVASPPSQDLKDLATHIPIHTVFGTAAPGWGLPRQLAETKISRLIADCRFPIFKELLAFHPWGLPHYALYRCDKQLI